jgi:hypothetical protein
VDYLLPSINGELDQQRELWSEFETSAEIEAAIERLIVDRFGSK